MEQGDPPDDPPGPAPVTTPSRRSSSRSPRRTTTPSKEPRSATNDAADVLGEPRSTTTSPTRPSTPVPKTPPPKRPREPLSPDQVRATTPRVTFKTPEEVEAAPAEITPGADSNDSVETVWYPAEEEEATASSSDPSSSSVPQSAAPAAVELPVIQEPPMEAPSLELPGEVDEPKRKAGDRPSMGGLEGHDAEKRQKGRRKELESS